MARFKSGALVVLMLCFLGFVGCHKKNIKYLDQLKDDIEELESTARDNNEMIDILEDTLNEMIENITNSEDTDATDIVVKTQTNVEEPVAEQENYPDDRIGKLLAHYQCVVTKMNLIKQFIKDEASVDGFLSELGNKLNIDFKIIKDSVEKRTQFWNEKFVSKIDKVDTTLQSVDYYARSRNKDVAGAIYYGGIGSACESGITHCRIMNSSCYYGKCQCDTGLSYDALSLECVEECRFYGDTFQVIPKYILRGFNTVVLNETSIKECKDACREAVDFECRSVEYFPRWQECYLSDVIKSNETEVAWEYNSAGNHYHRDCAYY